MINGERLIPLWKTSEGVYNGINHSHHQKKILKWLKLIFLKTTKLSQ
jgi:hypothetical protein